MNLSLNWLNDYVNTEEILLPKLISGLTMSGSKVEKSRDLSEPLSKIVIGKVTEIKKHENSDKLWICKVNIGETDVQIVTGAQNVFEGAVIPVVLDGGTVINRQDGSVTKIKKGKLRGAVSNGMLCSPDEIGMDRSDFPNADEDGILILNKEDGIEAVEIGSDALEFFGLNDTVIEFEITNNRADCLAVTGLAREVAATFDLPLEIPEPQFKGCSGDINAEVSVTVENKQLCSRYMAGLVKNVKIKPSPRWLTARLKAQGVRPINNIVDITNYVMLEYGYPLHAFDKRYVGGGGITVRNAKQDEEITLLDGNTVSLDSDILVIADKNKPVAVAGVMGGEYSGVSEDTDTVVFEAACFDGVSVRRAAKKIGRRTESSSRFEKSLNPANVKTALLRALQLVEELGCGEVCISVIDCANYIETEKRVPHDYKAVNSFLGTDIPENEQINIFKRLELGYDDNNKQVIVPSFRADINLPCDLAEEVARIYGYDKIESTLPRLGNNANVSVFESYTQKLVSVLTAQGCCECITYSFVSPKMNAIAPNSDNPVALKNPFGEETSVMRTSMIASVLKVVVNNINAGNSEARLFEIGRVYGQGKESDVLCIGLYGKDESFFTLKGIVQEIAGCFKIDISTSVKRYTEMPFHPGRAAHFDYIKFGELSPIVLRDYGISERVYIAEIVLEELFNHHCRSGGKTIYTPIPRFPAAVRDLSLVCDDETESGAIVSIVKGGCRRFLESVEFFDVFKGGNLEDGKKSLSYKLTFRKPDGTLTDEEVDTAVKQILGKLEENNIKLRR
ncbi:MAG: phenylalanine--tRNA ligase subunit beta [Oscillospiraceae bacterium]|nr:phenylalanine--tRNA ligase subunit beta [Oscillospiraceae bacterium]